MCARITDEIDFWLFPPPYMICPERHCSPQAAVGVLQSPIVPRILCYLFESFGVATFSLPSPSQWILTAFELKRMYTTFSKSL